MAAVAWAAAWVAWAAWTSNQEAAIPDRAARQEPAQKETPPWRGFFLRSGGAVQLETTIETGPEFARRELNGPAQRPQCWRPATAVDRHARRRLPAARATACPACRPCAAARRWPWPGRVFADRCLRPAAGRRGLR